jgi:kumamolisin
MASTKMVPIPGSEKKPLHKARMLAPARPDERFEVTVQVRPKKELPSLDELTQRSVTKQPPMTHAEYEAAYGADPADIARVEQFAKDNGLTVVANHPDRRSVMLSGTVAQFNKAFGVELRLYEHPHGTYRGREGFVHVPEGLSGVIRGVFGLDNRPVAQPHLRRLTAATPNAAGAVPFDPPQVAQIYNFPTGVDGTGQCIGILELGGGFRSSDLQAFFSNLGLPTPTVIPISVDQAPTTAGIDLNADGEVALDIEVAGGVAPGATIAVYFAPNDRASKGFLDCLKTAVHDQTNKPSVISISWGGPEQSPSDSFQDHFNETLKAAAMMGITVCVAAGDNGAADMGPLRWDGEAHADFPASSPLVLACGGTRLLASGGQIKSETVWDQHFADTSPDAGQFGTFGATGGGVSAAFALPDFQSGAGVPDSVNPGGGSGRGVPDVAGNADPATGFNIRVDGRTGAIGGTSGVAPLWAGLIALANQKLNRRVGFINPKIYAIPANQRAFQDITQGDNLVNFEGSGDVGYQAGTGWDACTGLGSPNGTKLIPFL